MTAKIEQSLRQKLAAAHQIIHMIGCDDLLATHLSVKIPDTDHLLITPLNVPFDEMTASKMIKADYDGNAIDDNGYKIMRQATNIHAYMHKHNHNIIGAIHTHSLYGTAVASLECGFLFTNQHSLRFYNDIAYHDLEGLALEFEGANIVKSLGDKKLMILRNHGLLSTGKSIEEALYRMYYFERLCHMQIVTMSANSKIHAIPKEVCERTKAQYDSIMTPEIEFAALVRRLERQAKVDYHD